MDVRVKRPVRDQIQFRVASLEQLITKDHRVRAVWAYVDALDLTSLYQAIRAVVDGPGRDAVDPKILFALWMYATLEGVSSARHLHRLTERDLPYMWLCGEVGVNHHLLSDFRHAQADLLDQLLTDTIATLMHQKLVTLETVAQDGMRVRAHAGSSSFRREKTLQQCRSEAEEQVRRLREESEDESKNDASNARQKAAKERAARERTERVEKALEELKALQEQKEKRKKGSAEKARVSTTDPEARVMKMADGGFRPAYNVQFATDGDTRLIVAVHVTNNGSDGGQMLPMQQDIVERYGQVPDQYVVDGGFVTTHDITQLEQSGSQVIAPMLDREHYEKSGGDAHERRRADTDEMYDFRQRMKTEGAKATLKRRPSIAEFPNAVCRNQGLHQLPVRSLAKVKAIALWHALSFNFRRLLDLGVA